MIRGTSAQASCAGPTSGEAIRPSDPGRPAPSGWPRPAVVAVVAVLLLQWAYVALAPFERLNLYVNDDAYYYLFVARNWIAHGFPSFDGVEPTNGFQPLWQLIVLPAALAGRRLVQLRLMLAAGGMLFQIGVLLGTLGLFRLAGRRVALAFLALAEFNVVLAWTFALDGMEASLQVALLGAVLWRLGRDHANGSDRVGWLGALAGLYGVSRLDGLAMLPCLGVYLWRRRVRGPRLAAFALLAALPAATSLLVNELWTGDPLPVSGEVKLVANERAVEAAGGGVVARVRLGAPNLARAIFSVASRTVGGYVYFAARLLDVPHRWISFPAGFAAIGLLCLGLARLCSRSFRPLRTALAPFAGAAAMSLAFYTWAYPATFHLYDWYFAAELFLSLVLLAVAAAPWLGRGAGVAALASLGAVGFAGFLTNQENLAHLRPVQDAVRYVESSPDLRSRRVASWDAGVVAFLLRQPVTNLDGLVNSRAFFDRFVAGPAPIRDYLDARGIDVLVNPITEDPAGIARSGFRGLALGSFAVEHVTPRFVAPFGEVRRAVVLRLLPAASARP